MTAYAFLAVDIGNTRVKWGWRLIHADARAHDAHTDWTATGACRHEDFARDFAAPWAVDDVRALVCSVAAESLTQGVVKRLIANGLRVERFGVQPRAGGVENRYRAPTLGADRFAAAIGARAHRPTGALVVASFGTATTIDTVSPDQAYLGGVILPGVELMFDALAHGTARLPRAMLIDAPVAFPSDTAEAIAEGVARAQLGALAQTWRVAIATFGTASLILTGGGLGALRERVADVTGANFLVADNLVLDGLVRAATHHSP
ncbi:MAG TPA: type III pantothenate kinase [Burkholderiaceae bacterium]|nr:type III pantothenate kinase [Burkholderiaceae bacterium]